MCSNEQSPDGWLPQPSKQRQLLRALADHHCGVYFIHTLEGFVHNLNSPLQILWMRSEQVQHDIRKLRQKLPGGDKAEVEELTEQMNQRIDSFIKGLDDLNTSLQFLTTDLLGKRQSEIGDVNVNVALKDCLFLLKADMFFKHRVKLQLEMAENLPSIEGRHTDFCVIILHVIQNSLDAMIHAESKILTIKTIKEQDDVIINIQDTGPGFSEGDAARAFEPFFTTKSEIEYNGKIERRLGLGLSIVSILVQEYAGDISFESLSDKTTFVVRIPSHR